MTEFNLRVIVCDVLTDTTLTDPTDVANEALNRITRGQYRHALQQSLREYARQVMKSQRNTRGRASGAPARSAKVEAIRHHWAQQLDARIHTGSNGWKLLRDCTYDDLQYAAAERRRVAKDNLASADWYDYLSSYLLHDKSCPVGDLPDEVLTNLLGGAA